MYVVVLDVLSSLVVAVITSMNHKHFLLYLYKIAVIITAIRPNTAWG